MEYLPKPENGQNGQKGQLNIYIYRYIYIPNFLTMIYTGVMQI